MCPEHCGEETPAVAASKLSKDSLDLLNEEFASRQGEARKDSIFVVEEIRGCEHRSDGTFYKIKWESYKKETWEPSINIPCFIKNYYAKTGNAKIPQPRVKHTKKIVSSGQSMRESARQSPSLAISRQPSVHQSACQ